MTRTTPTALLRKLRVRDDHSLADCELLLKFARERNQDAFEELVARHSPMVLGVCRRGLANPADAEDACQAVFLILAQKAKSVRWQTSVANWLYTTARKVARNARLSASRRAVREARAATPELTSPVDAMSGRELLTALDEELEKLAPRYREPLVLCHLEGLTRDEAASRLGVPVATLKGQLERGRKRLAEALTKRGCALGSALLLAASASGLNAMPARLQESINAAVAGTPSTAVAELMKVTLVNNAFSKLKTLALTVVGLTALVFGVGSMPTAAEPTKPEKAPADKSEKPTPPPVAEKAKPENKEAMLTGRVLGPDGKPVAAAKLYQPARKTLEPISRDDIATVEVGKTDELGNFSVKLMNESPRNYLIAYSPGLAVDWLEIERSVDLTKPIELRLPKEMPITGRVMNTEGKPVKGVRVSLGSIYVPLNNDLDGYLAGWLKSLRETLSTPVKRLYLPLDGIAGAAMTDADGRFKLNGLGEEYLAYLLFEGAGIARSQPQVVARKGFDPKPFNDELRKKEHDDLVVLNRFLGLVGPDFVFVVEPGRVIEGTVTASGKPVAGCHVFAHTGWGDGVSALTDKEGKYRLEGIPKRKLGYSVSVQAPKSSGLLSTQGTAVETDGVGSVRVDVKLSRGVIVSGRIIDKQTGKGVQAGVRLAPLPGNKFFGATPGTDNYRGDRTMTSTDAEGRFRMNTIPGKALFMVQAHSDEKFAGQYLNPYRQAIPDPDHKDLFAYDADDDSWRITTVDNSLEFLSTEQTVKVIEVKEQGETTIELTVDRGVVGKIAIRDAEGKPLAGAYVAGLTASWPITYKLPEATASIYALNPEKPRKIAVFHPGKKLAGTATVRGDEKEPVIVKLVPVGTITGRFMEDSVPLANAEITVNPPNRILSELYRFTVQERPKVITDAEGKFTLPDIVPGVDFYIQTRRGDNYYAGKPKLGLQSLKPGEKKDLGERTLERRQ
ncbi:MAG TPA: sigma-70 family RNA polymerase sigma factor [Gemmataceae bacterium]|jgi:RNA polymerase sigma factor (sigma-70 family)|nr:sigma-70 family RNA polymerase sigma factor [Gemmataceae bacterium]